MILYLLRSTYVLTFYYDKVAEGIDGIHQYLKSRKDGMYVLDTTNKVIKFVICGGGLFIIQGVVFPGKP